MSVDPGARGTDEGTGPDLTRDIHFLATRTAAIGAVSANRELAALGLRVRSYSVLSLACTASPQTQKEIAEFLLLDPSQVVVLLDDLEGRKLVRRIPDPSDRRARLVTATPEGHRVYAEAREVVADADRPALADLDMEEQATLRSLLQRVALGAEAPSRLI